MPIVSAASQYYGRVNTTVPNRILFRYVFTGISAGNGEGEANDLRMPVGPSGRNSRGTLISLKVAVTGAASDFDFTLRTASGQASSYGDESQFYRATGKNTFWQENAINIPYVSKYGGPLVFGILKNNTATVITRVMIEMVMDVDGVQGAGIGAEVC